MGKKSKSKTGGVSLRSPEEIANLKISGKITALALKKAIEEARVGMSLIELDKIAEEEILKLGGQSSFKTVPGYFWTTCLTINDEVVHGTPRDIKLNDGDVLNIDLGAIYKGWHTDAAWTIVVGKSSPDKDKFLKIGEQTLWNAIEQAKVGNQIGDISATIAQGVETGGYSVVRSLSGHGVGRKPHEEPTIPGFGKFKTGMVLKSGMSLAIEVIYLQGKDGLYQKEDNWTLASMDGSLGGLFEMSVIIQNQKADVLTDWRNV
ncbi:MAG: type I methionyl aminopeptidase [Candidatus Daviesbacteria bacterium]|nr:type I methionyl aminopeptidase [Candidatus Daviesbacteria bacterium]